MEEYESPVNFLNVINTGHQRWTCEFQAKDYKLPKIEPEPQAVVANNQRSTAPRPLKIWEKVNKVKLDNKSRLPEIKKLIRKLDDEVREELGEADRNVMRKAEGAGGGGGGKDGGGGGSMAGYVNQKRKDFFARYLLREMRNETARLKSDSKRQSDSMEERAEKLQNDALAFADFIKEVDQQAVETVKQTEVDSRLLAEVKLEQKSLQNKEALMKSMLINKDQELMGLLNCKSFILLVMHNNLCARGMLCTMDMWKRYRATPEYTSSTLSPPSAPRLTPAPSGVSRVPSGYSRGNALKKSGGSRVKVSKEPKRNIFQFLLDEPACTRIIYPEQWSGDDTFAESETAKISSVLDQPRWLLKILRNFEEDNINMITNFRSSEKKIDKLKTQFVRTERRYEEQLAGTKLRCRQLRQRIDLLEAQADAYEFMCGRMEDEQVSPKMAKAAKHAGPSLFDQIIAKITKIFKWIQGPGVDMVKVSQLNMLLRIEQEVTDYFEVMDDLNTVTLFKMIRKFEKERRGNQIKEKEEEARIKAEERKKESEEKAKDGKGVEFIGRKLKPRSFLAKKTAQKSRNNDDDDEMVWYFTEF